MTTVVSMLSNETVNLPTPGYPAFVDFIQRQTMVNGEGSINFVSVTNPQGR